MVKIVSWNINTQAAPWQMLQQMHADVALLQEASPNNMPASVDIGPYDPWIRDSYDRWPMVVKLSDRIRIDWFKPVTIPIGKAAVTEIAVSDIRTLAAARITPSDGEEPFVVVSMYARWITPSVKTSWKVGYADASAHRVISDLSTFIGYTNPSTHRILAAGDLNTILGETRLSLPARDGTVFARMDALGLEFLGPQHPYGKQADPMPRGVPADTKNVPTYLTAMQRRNMRDAGILSGNQLDYVFASRGFHNSVLVHALNDPADWGPSDHCRVWIEVQQ